jgi:hypothetical protein
MLGNSIQASMTAPALSGTVSAATAQGYLPQYPGAAAASLAPSAFSVTAPDRDTDRSTLKPEQLLGIVPLIAANFLPENRPLNRDQSPRPIRPSPDTIGAEGYMRYISKKDDQDKKILEQGWNANTTATGPVIGSNW